MIHQDIDKAKRALDHLQAERQAQNDRIQLAIDTKRKFDATKMRFLSPSTPFRINSPVEGAADAKQKLENKKIQL